MFFLFYSDENSFNSAMRAAAHKADKAVRDTMREYRRGNVKDEEEITGSLQGALSAALRGQIGGFKWDVQIMRHRQGIAAEERATGADMIIKTNIKGFDRTHKKGTLIQAKRVEIGEQLSGPDKTRLDQQCRDMLAISPESFVFDYSKKKMRIGSAERIEGSLNRNPAEECALTPFRFFYNLFTCNFGDRNLFKLNAAELAEALGQPDELIISGIETHG